ncbi:LVIS_2131 family protein [Lactobacillus sp. Sy-1]|uniref:LVIS_2131 family protein n=1 Tax=Lactobacillus sp. Sy-1 TaxID=2109645 RepID=UPI001C583D14|nr:LVIS_2131 family protein [Lactobacillus sp. Sy-1]MBW1605258.1 hypothetical protein [Lactobacillus sp. Sy-1]
MISAWNLIGLSVWAIIGGYLIYLIFAIRNRKRQAMRQQDNKLAKQNLIISIFQGLGLAVAIILMVTVTLLNDKSTSNVSVVRSYRPIALDTNGRKSYYVNVYNDKRQPTRQYYTYLTRGKHYRIASGSSMIISSGVNVSLPIATYHSDVNRMKQLDHKYQKAWVETISAKYKPSVLNGLGLKVGRQASYYVLIRVPNQSFIYYH